MSKLLPPHSIESEMALLGSLLLNDESKNADIIAKCKSVFFYRVAHQSIFEAMQALVRREQAIDVVLLRDALNEKGLLDECGGALYLMQLAEFVPTAANADHYLSVIREKYDRREMMAVAEMLSQVASDETRGIEEAKSAASALLVSMGQTESGTCFQASEILSEMWDEIDERARSRGALAGRSWGIPSLDYFTSGLEESKLYIVGGRPAMGKTGLMTSVAGDLSLRSKGAVVIFSIEMSRKQIMARIVCSHALVDSKRMREGRLTEAEYHKIQASSEAFWMSNLVIDDTTSPSAAYMTSRSMELAVKYGRVDAIFVDYLGLIRPASDRMTDVRQVIGDNAKAMKALARTLQCPVILLAQLNRGVEHRDNKRPTMADLAESGAIEAAADVIIFPFRPQYYEFSEAARNFEMPEEAELIIAKCRDGATGTAMAEFVPAYTLFRGQRRS